MKKGAIRILFVIVLILIIFFVINAYRVYKRIYHDNVSIDNKTYSLYIPSDATFSTIKKIMQEEGILEDIESFIWVAKRMNYPNKIYPGHYTIMHSMSNKQLVTLLRAGMQTPVKVTFNNINTLKELASVISEQIEADSASIINLLRNSDYISKMGFTHYTIPGLFIPNTYEFYWNTTAKAFIEKMHKEYQKFWNKERISKASKLNLTKNDVSVLASIVQKETTIEEEMPVIAGVYINRLRRRMHLQADPTIRFLVSDTIKRVLTRHLSIPSPYNTYLNYGLPPGPICIPSITAIDAVLNFKDHDYLYFCAKEDFSGYHNFARTLKEHNKNARLYRQALNKKRIWR